MLLALYGAAFAAAANLDEQLLAAEEAYRTRDIKALEFYAPALKDHLLANYPQYWLLSLALKDADPAQVSDFLTRYPDGPLSERLRIDWLKLLGQDEHWDAFAAQFPKLKQEDTTLTCYDIQRRARDGAIPQAESIRGRGSRSTRRTDRQRARRRRARAAPREARLRARSRHQRHVP